MSDRVYRWIFLIGSIFNISVGLLLIIFTRLSIEVFFGPQADPDNRLTILFYRMFMMAVIVFGIGYFLVYLDLTKNRGIVLLGALSKLILVAVSVVLVLGGDATTYLLLAVAPDFLFTLVFCLFLWQKRTNAG